MFVEKEMPELEKQVWQKFKNKDFLLIGIDTKETKEKVDLFIKNGDYLSGSL